MELIEFRVTDFRSVKDSDWVQAGNVTSLIGTNESGKTNLLLPLWKLKPARDGEINMLSDCPRKRYAAIRAIPAGRRPVFIRARFRTTPRLQDKLIEDSGHTKEQVAIVEIQRNFDGDYRVLFPEVAIAEEQIKDLGDVFGNAVDGIEAADLAPDQKILNSWRKVARRLDKLAGTLDKDTAAELLRVLQDGIPSEAPTAELLSQHVELSHRIEVQAEGATILRHDDKLVPLVIKRVPAFVYYSNYGNLDSEIYLPHVIANLARIEALGAHEAAKARTLRVLFEFVRLSPSEILELGKESPAAEANNPAGQAEADKQAERKKEREVLLQSASTTLTDQFREWWRQGDYRFRLQADGSHFRIWVSDDRRPEDIELENRSTGLQWFLSFYLTFLVESENAHADAILLLDEPGNSLHPIAQEDLSIFFQQLSEENQIIFTTHSPFMVDPDHLDRVRAVYVNNKGHSTVSPDLRAQESMLSQTRSIYPVHAALGLQISRSMLIGCQPIIVEGASDQIYLTAMKNYLIAKGKLTPGRELLFFPAGGVRGISSLVAILAGADEKRPFVLVDADGPGTIKADKLRKDVYNDCPERVLVMDSFSDIKECEIEDLWPPTLMVDILTKFLRGPGKEFDEVHTQGAIINQAESYAEKNNVALEKPGWKVEVAELAKRFLLKKPQSLDNSGDYVARWEQLFEALTKDKQSM